MGTISWTLDAIFKVENCGFDSNFIPVCFQGFSKPYPYIGTDNGFAPIRRQIIIWTNDDTVHWRTYAS